MVRSRGPILVLGMVARHPLAGIAWQAIHHLVGLRSLGWDPYYVEDSGAWPGYAGASAGVAWLAGVMRRFGFEDRWALVDCSRSGRFAGDEWHLRSDVEVHGLSRGRLDALYREAEAILNLCGATRPRAEHRRGPRLVYLQTDPGAEQVGAAAGDPAAIDFLRCHDVLFTYGENLGAPDCPLPVERLTWKRTRPPVVPGLWDAPCDPAAPCFTTVATWRNKGGDTVIGGETYVWSKHVNFLRFRDLPRRTGCRLCLALGDAGPEVEAQLRAAGWSVVDARAISADPDAYRAFIRASRGEFSIAKDIYVRPRSGWFSDRSVCYLAAGKPVVMQDTGFGKFIPTGEGLFAFSTLEEAADALARIEADYPAHSTAARRIAAEHFDAHVVLRQLLAEAGLD